MITITKICFKKNCNVWLEPIKFLPKDKKGYKPYFNHIHKKQIKIFILKYLNLMLKN